MKNTTRPKINSKWQHYNKHTIYTVLMLTNTKSTNDSYQIQVVYQGKNGNIWSRPLSDWYRSMSLYQEKNVEDPIKQIYGVEKTEAIQKFFETSIKKQFDKILKKHLPY